MKNIKIIITDTENYINKLKSNPDCIEHYNSSERNLYSYYRWVGIKMHGISLIKKR